MLLLILIPIMITIKITTDSKYENYFISTIFISVIIVFILIVILECNKNKIIKFVYNNIKIK